MTFTSIPIPDKMEEKYIKMYFNELHHVLIYDVLTFQRKLYL